jgi:hypothetical protein
MIAAYVCLDEINVECGTCGAMNTVRSNWEVKPLYAELPLLRKLVSISPKKIKGGC